MNKSAIYATVKTSNIIVGVTMGLAVVHIQKVYGWGWASTAFLLSIILSFVYGQFGNWIFRKFDIED